MKLLDDYFTLQKQIYDHFGYVEDWVVIPLEDDTKYYWALLSENNEDGCVRYAETEELLNDPEENYYESEIYTQRFLPKWVYRAEDCTLICIDTKTDGNKFLAVFDNTKERHLT